MSVAPTRLKLDQVEIWPYSLQVYIGRILWFIVQSTLWRLSWGRITIFQRLLLKAFGAKVARKSQYGYGVRIEFPWLLESGDYVAIGPRVNIYNLGGIKIGNHVVISQDAFLCGGTHDIRDPHMTLVRKKIVIENQVWICAGAFIGPGVTIGEGAIVGARACVTKDVKPWTVVVGNPAKFLKRRVLRKKT